MRRPRSFNWLAGVAYVMASIGIGIFSEDALAADTQAPTAPTNLAATVASTTQINLTWKASTDNVGVTGYRIERCTGSTCTTFAQVGTSTATSYSSTGLAPVTAYRFRVRANDAAGNLSGYSNIVVATTPADTQAPTAPTNLTATVVSGTQINLSWTASTDNVGVTGYRVERCAGASCTSFAQIGTPTTTTYNDTTLTNGTSYSYRVRATDAAGNLSGYSGTVSATTLDTQAPTAPTNLAATVVSSSQVNLTWTASTDNVGVTGYRIERCTGSTCTTFTQIATSTTPSYSNTGLTASTIYRFRVRANDAAGNLSAYSSIVNATTQAPDTQAPTAPTNLAASVASASQINLTWTASTDNVGVTGYRVERCSGAACTTFAQIATPTANSYSDTGLTGTTAYSYRVRATDAAGNLSGYSNTASATTADNQPPTAPTNLAASVISGTQINLTWTASTDNVGVTGYRVERCSGATCTTFVQISAPTTTTYSDTGLTGSTSYSYRVRATDAAGNLSGYSNTVSATTADNQPPTAPSNLAASVISATQINLSWTASSDNVGVTGYRVERCNGASCTTFAQIATPTTTTYSDTGLTGTTSYSYRIRATDAAGNLSVYSNTASATTSDNQPPTAPTNLAASVMSGTQINLTWTASTDNVGVVGYMLERCSGASCTTFAQIATLTTTTYSDTGLTGSTSYSYRVRATDAAGNLSGYSNNSSATTADNQPPTTPTNLAAIAISGTQINLAWTASTDNVGVVGYLIERCSGTSCTTFDQIATATATTYSDTGLTATTSYTYRVRATDAAGNLSGYSNSSSVTTADNQPPTAPSNLAASVISSTQINLSWTASSDNVGVTEYLVERCQGNTCTSFAQIGSSTTPGYNDTGLNASTTYIYRVRATDAAGNLSGYSTVASATTPAPPDMQPPTVPTALTATPISNTQISLTWSPSTDNVGVTAYQIARCSGPTCSNFVQIAASAAAGYTDTGLAPSTTYSYEVSAADAAGNMSGYSTQATATTIGNPSAYTYDANGHLTTVTTSVGGTVTYTYDAAGHLSNIQISP